MKIAVTGYNGNIGSRLVHDYGFIPFDADIRISKDIEEEIKFIRPNLIVHLAGRSDVNYCQKLENQEDVIQTNLRGSANIFEQSARENIPVVYVSSDHLFGGNMLGSYTENAQPAPKNYYGMSKLAVEGLSKVYPNVNIVRTSTLFWGGSPSVFNTIMAIEAGSELSLPTYMWRSFLHIDHFCEMLVSYCNTEIAGNPKVLNLSGSKIVSWYRFIKEYAQHLGLDTKNVHPKFFEGKHEFAPRPLRAGLNVDLSKKLGYPQYSYKDGISRGL